MSYLRHEPRRPGALPGGDAAGRGGRQPTTRGGSLFDAEITSDHELSADELSSEDEMLSTGKVHKGELSAEAIELSDSDVEIPSGLLEEDELDEADHHHEADDLDEANHLMDDDLELPSSPPSPARDALAAPQEAPEEEEGLSTLLASPRGRGSRDAIALSSRKTGEALAARGGARRLFEGPPPPLGLGRHGGYAALDPEEAEADLRAEEATGGAPALLEDEPEPLEDAPTRIERDPSSLQRREHEQAHLLIIGGNNRGQTFPLKLGDNSIGRGIDNDVVLADISVSRKHTLVCHEHGSFVVRDLGSGNGTLLNGKRINMSPLRDGDQLELGNTLLRFVCPEEQPRAARAPMYIEETGPDDDGVPLIVARQARETASIPAPTSRLRDELQRLWESPLRNVLIFGLAALVVLLGVTLGVRSWRNARRQQELQLQARQGQSREELAAREYQEGIRESRAHNWEQARTHFLAVLRLIPGADYAKRGVEQAGNEIKGREALQRANDKLAAKEYTAAREALSTISSTSAYAGEAQSLKQQVDADQLANLLHAAASLRQANDLEGARAMVKEALSLAPTNPAVQKLSHELSMGKVGATRPLVETRVRVQLEEHRPAKRPPPPRVNRPPPEPATPTAALQSGKLKAALAFYRKQQWGPAYQEAKAAATSLRGAAQEAAQEQAQVIQQVGQGWGRAAQARDPQQRMRLFEQVLQLDRKIQRGQHQATLKKLIAEAASAAAASAVARGDYQAAARALEAAEKSSGRDPALTVVRQSIESKAMELAMRGNSLRNSNKAQARSLWQQVLRMVPPSSPAYKKAYGWLNDTAAPTALDEDED